MVMTTLSVEQIRNRLLQKMDQNDQLIVITAAAPAAWYLTNPICSDWLTEKL
jgi:hypothetical protein